MQSDFASGMSRFLATAAGAYGVHDSAMGASLAATLERCASIPCRPDPIEVPACRHIATIVEAEDWSDAGLKADLAPLLSGLPWHAKVAARIAPGFDRCYGAAEILGPTGMIFAEDCRFGLFLLAPGVYYPPHAHEAEELYLVLSGTAKWLSAGGEELRLSPGKFAHHRPWQRHATRSGSAPLLATWAWSGNLDFGTYRIEASG